MKKYLVTLTEEERASLEQLIRAGKGAARKLAHARILLKADTGPSGPDWDDASIAESLEIGVATVERVRKQFVEEGLEAALTRRKPSRTYRRKLDGAGEAHLIALTCGAPPAGQARWTLRLLAAQMVALEYVDTVSPETVRQTLKKTNSSRG
jgi:transposase